MGPPSCTQHRYRKWWEAEAFLSRLGRLPLPLQPALWSAEAVWNTGRNFKRNRPLWHSQEGGSALGLAKGWGQTGNGIGDQGPWAPVVPAACASSPALPPSLLPCGCSQVSPPNPFPCHSSPSLQLLIPDRRGEERERRVESFFCWLFPEFHLPIFVGKCPVSWSCSTSSSLPTISTLPFQPHVPLYLWI